MSEEASRTVEMLGLRAAEYLYAENQRDKARAMRVVATAALFAVGWCAVVGEGEE